MKQTKKTHLQKAIKKAKSKLINELTKIGILNKIKIETKTFSNSDIAQYKKNSQQSKQITIWINKNTNKIHLQNNKTKPKLKLWQTIYPNICNAHGHALYEQTLKNEQLSTIFKKNNIPPDEIAKTWARYLTDTLEFWENAVGD